MNFVRQVFYTYKPDTSPPQLQPDVVTGDEKRDNNDEDDSEEQAQFDAKDRRARDSMLEGVSGATRDKICGYKSAFEMWKALKAAHTSKHPYVEIGLLKRQLYSSYYMKSKTMDEWFSKLEQMRRALERLGRPVFDDEFTQVVLFCVVFTHRQFTIQRICSDPTKSELEKLVAGLLDEDAVNKYIAEHRDEWVAANRRRPGLVEANGGRRNKRRRGAN